MNRTLMTWTFGFSHPILFHYKGWTDSIFSHHHSEVSCFLQSSPNVCVEGPLLLSHRRWPCILSWPGNVAWKMCVYSLYLCSCLGKKRNPHPTIIKLLWVPELTPDGSHAAPRWTLKRQQRTQMGRVAFFRPSTFLFHRWVQIIFCAILSDYCITVAKGGCIGECRGN